MKHWLKYSLIILTLTVLNSKGFSVTDRRIKEETIQEYREGAAFDYIEYDENTDIWKNFKSWLESILNSFDVDPKNTSTFIEILGYVFEVLIYATALFALVMILLHILKIKLRNRSNSEDEDNITFEELSKHVTTINWDQQINEAIGKGSYNLASRFLFLKTLQTLDRKESILWSKEKTNREYTRELPEQLRPEFEELVYFFNQVWFGEFDIDGKGFDSINEKHIRFINAVH